MTDNFNEKIKEEIKKHLIKTQEDIGKEVMDSIIKLKNIISIEDGTGKIIILDKKINNTDKIKLLLIGKYLAKYVEIIDSMELNIKQISEELAIVKTTLSAPLGDLVGKGVVIKNEGNYKFNENFFKEEIEKIKVKIENG